VDPTNIQLGKTIITNYIGSNVDDLERYFYLNNEVSRALDLFRESTPEFIVVARHDENYTMDDLYRFIEKGEWVLKEFLPKV
jgi:hypothetical protein